MQKMMKLSLQHCHQQRPVMLACTTREQFSVVTDTDCFIAHQRSSFDRKADKMFTVMDRLSAASLPL